MQSKLKLDADYGELIATVEDASGFAPGMGVTLLDKVSPEGWTPSVRTIVSIEGNTLHFDRFLQMDYSVANQGEVFNTFPLVAGFDVEDVQVEDLTVDGSRAGSGILDGCQTGAHLLLPFPAHDHPQLRGAQLSRRRHQPRNSWKTRWWKTARSEDNAYLGIHLGTGALRGIVRDCRAHDNGKDGLFLCWRVQHARYERNQSWNNGQDGISLGHKDTDNIFIGNSSAGTAAPEFTSATRLRPTPRAATPSREHHRGQRPPRRARLRHPHRG